MNPIDFKSKFDWKVYVSRYPDLKGADSLEKAWGHANNFGWKENRVIFDDVHLQDKLIAFKNTGLVIPQANINNEKNVQLVEEGIDMYNVNNLTDEHMSKVTKNVHGFSDQIKPYKNILFISGDYPGYGGAATNCYELQKYFKTLEHNTFGFYFNYETGTNAKHEKYEDHIIDDVCNLKSLEFKPDLIVLKSPINMDLKSLFKCPVYYLIGGIYKNDLDKYYYELTTKEDNDKYINNDVLKHIAKYESFVNSQHTADILEKFYGVSTNIFYSSFVPYVDKKVLIDPDFEKRKYDYGLIVSNFDRPIKNVEKSVEFLKGKENVILIGKGSHRYESYGFTCVGLVDKQKIDKYYKQIKYILQDSYYESCSNVKIEGLFNGCEMYKFIQTLLYENNITYELKKNTRYIIGNVREYYKNIDVNKLFIDGIIQSYLLDHTKTKDIIFFVCPQKDIVLSSKKIFEQSHKKYSVIGYTENIYSDDYLIELYYNFGLNNYSKDELGISLFYDDYIENLNRKYNKFLYMIISSYFYGTILHTNYKSILLNNLSNHTKFHDTNVLIISKLIQGFGGVQKTSTQLIHYLDKYYNVYVLSHVIKQKSITKYSFNYKRLNNVIHNGIIVQMNVINEVENYINSNIFEFIINNKLNSCLQWNLKQKLICLCHNSMDPFNNDLLKYQDRIEKVLTVNNFHKNLLFSSGFKKPIEMYNNYVYSKRITDTVLDRSKFNYNIIFVGRLVEDKNVQMLIDGVNIYNNNSNKKITFYIVGDGYINYSNLNENIKFTGRLVYNEIVKLFSKMDYVVSGSLTEGKPFSIIEALSNGIPCIHSNINGINEIIYEGKNGFLFKLQNYDEVRYDLSFDKLSNINQLSDDSKTFSQTLIKAYKFDISIWNIMSKNCILYTRNFYEQDYCEKKNMKAINTNVVDNIVSYNKKIKIFINFKPNEKQSYGGGNISVYYLAKAIDSYYSNFDLTYELETDIDIYLIIDPFKCKERFKKYSLDDVISHRNTNNENGKIVIRVNDCDKTRLVTDNSRSREYQIIKNIDEFDYMIFNSDFIKEYYQTKIPNNKLENIENRVIINGCDNTLFTNNDKTINNNSWKIVTHHWSDNMNKGYDTYLKLWNYCNKSNIFDFIFIGKNVPLMFKNVKVHGPYVGKELNDKLNDCHIYVTDSRYDSCPNHVLEAISCGLPILYSNVVGGAKELCQLPPYKIGEMYEDYDDLLKKIDLIRNNYDFYRENIKKSIHLYDIKYCANKYLSSFTKVLYPYTTNIILPYENNIITFICSSNDTYFIINDIQIKLSKGNNVFVLNKQNKQSIHYVSKTNNSVMNIHKYGKKKLYNDKGLNLLFCSDSNYFVGLFAVLNSVVQNTKYINDAHINFMIPLYQQDNFTNYLLEFENKANITLNKSIIYIDSDVLDPIFFQSQVYNGGGHLLNVGNLSRLLIGDLMEYKKLLYLDCDSIVQYDIIERLIYFEMNYDYYASCANKKNANTKKQIVIKFDNILNFNNDLKALLGIDINKDEYVYMGAPFLTNCNAWTNVYNQIVEIIKKHNQVAGGIYKLFTMSLQNIVFYNKTANLDKILNTIVDLGSKRKEWAPEDLVNKDVIDWSGVFKPWYTNGLYKNLWLPYDILGLHTSCKDVTFDKNVVEKLKTNNNTKHYKYTILYVCDINYIKKKMSRVRFWAIECLEKHPDVRLIYTGPGFANFTTNKSLQQNILDLSLNFDLIIWYKPLNDNYNYDKSVKLPYTTCIRYNEMWDIDWTTYEIDTTDSDIIICHHKNDYLEYYKRYEHTRKKIIYIPHPSNPDIFKPLNKPKDIDILVSGITKEKHYPLKFRLSNLLKKHQNDFFNNYTIHFHEHPSYDINNSFKNIAQKSYNEIINRSKLCVACTSKYNYRLGKYVEIPMAGSVIIGDLPYEDERFKEFVVEVNNTMSDDHILKTIKNALDNNVDLEKKRNIGIKWSQEYTVEKYINSLLHCIFM